MADRLTSKEWEPVTFNYIDVDNRSYKNCVDVTIIFKNTQRKARLPRSLLKRHMAYIFTSDKQITMPAWLCEEQGLV